jgi:hypothetical protein
MRKALVLVFVGAMSVALAGMIGCTKDANGKWHPMWDKNKSTTQMSAQDDCAMCPGVQTAKADGTCPKCGMKVK